MSNKEWTIMIYLAGDNNLSVDMAYAMEQIKEVAGEEANGTNLFVYYDGNSESIPTLYCDFSDSANPKHVRSFKVPNKLYRVEPKRNENAADYRSVLNFVDWCLNKVEVGTGDSLKRGRRADKYGLIFSGHSLGFNDPGLFKDESSGKTMTMADMFLLIDRLTKSKDELAARFHGMDLEYEKDHRFDSDPDKDRRRSTVLVGQPLDILGFDSCVMGMLEVGYQFKTSVKTLIASEGSVPSAGWTYAKILGSLARDFTPLDDNEVAARFVTQFITSQNSFTVGGVSVDMAAWDMAKLDGLNNEFAKLANVLYECFDDRTSSIYRHMERALLQVHWKCQSYMYDQNVDIGDFCELLRDECVSLAGDLSSDDGVILSKVKQACDRVLSELTNVVILGGFSGGEYQYSNGISLFFPWSYIAYKAAEKYYKRLEFVDKGAGRSWSRLLERYLGEVTLRPFEDPEVLIPQRALAAASGVGVGEGAMLQSKHRFKSFLYNEDERSLGIGSQVEHLDSKMAGREDSKMAGREDSKMAGREDSKMAGREDSKMAGREDSKMAGREDSKMAGREDSKMAGREDSKMAGREDSKMAGREDSKMAGREDSKMAGREDSKMAGREDSKIAGREDSKIAGREDSKMAGREDSKMAGREDSKMAGREDSKMAGREDSKMAGRVDSKMAGRVDSKMAGREDSKMAGSGANAFFGNLQGFKNIQARWNISGFTKKPADDDKASESAKA